jgi:hypothetical protein
MQPSVSIIILNWNGWRDTIVCLDSLVRIDYKNFNVILVDNGSQDSSVVKIEGWSKHHVNFKLALVLNKQNLGFDEGNNIGVRFALRAYNPDYVYLLNNDTMVKKDFLSAIVRDAEKVGRNNRILQSFVLQMNNHNIIDSAGGTLQGKRFRIACIGAGEIDEGQYRSLSKIEFPIMTGVLISTDIIRNIGLFDPKFFIYEEDADFGWRAYLSGYGVRLSTNSRIYHKVSQSTKKYKSSKLRRLFTKNHIVLLIKNKEVGLTKALLRNLRRDLGVNRKNIGGLLDVGWSYFWVAFHPYIWRERQRIKRLRIIHDSEIFDK